MPRILPDALTAVMDSGVYNPYLKVLLFLDDEEEAITVDVLAFKIQDTVAECIIPYDAAYLDNAYFAIQRGAMIAGVPVTIRTMYYVITSMIAGPMGIEIKGNVLPRRSRTWTGSTGTR